MMKRLLLILCTVLVVLLAFSVAASAAGTERATSSQIVTIGNHSSTGDVAADSSGDNQCDGDADDLGGIRSGVRLGAATAEPDVVRYHTLILNLWLHMLWLR